MALIVWILHILLAINAKVVLGSETSWDGSISINYKDSIVQVGKVLKLNCTASKKITKTLDFDVKLMHLQAGDGKKMDDVKILSNVSIGFEENATFDSPSFYSCWYNDTLLLTEITMSYGAPPPEPVVENFVIHDWKRVELNLGPSRQQIEDTTGVGFYPNFTIRYSFLNCSECANECTEVRNLQLANWHTCDKDGVQECQTDDYSVHKTEIWYFFVQYSNVFGSSCALFNLTTADVIKPDRVEIVSVSVVNSTSIRIYLKRSSKCIDYKCSYNITYKAMNLEHENSSTNLTYDDLFHDDPFPISDLYPHGNYTIQVTASPQNGGLISDPSQEESVLLWEDVPAANPAFIAGAIEYYEVVDGRQGVKVYWQEIPEKDKNGYITSQCFKVLQGSTTDGDVCPNKTMNGDQLMKEVLNLKTGKDYTIMLSAATQNGTNMTLRTSILLLNGKTDDDLCVVRNVLAVHIKNSRRVNVSWENCDDTKRPITQNVIYICRKKRDERECEGPLNWTVFPPNVSHQTIDLPDDGQYRIAVSNIAGNSSRMVWSPCLFKEGAAPAKGTQGTFQQNAFKGHEIEYKLDKNSCKDNTGVVNSLKFIYYKRDGSGPKKTLLRDMPAHYLYSRTTFNLPVEELDQKYHVSVVAKSDGGEASWGDNVVDMKSLSEPLLYYLYLLLIIVVVVFIAVLIVVRRHYVRIYSVELLVKVPSGGDTPLHLDKPNDEQEQFYEYDEILSDGLIPAERKKHPSSNSSVSTAETSLSNVSVVIPTPSENETSGFNSSQTYDTSGSAMSYAKVALTDNEKPTGADITNMDNPKASDAAILNLDGIGNGCEPGYEKLKSVSVCNPYENLITPPMGHVLPVLRDNLRVPETRSNHSLSDPVDKSFVGKNAVEKDLIICDNSAQSGLDTTSESDINNDLTRLLTSSVPSSSSSGSNTDFTGGCTSQGSTNSNHLYRDNPQSTCSFESTSGDSSSRDGSNQDYRCAGPAGPENNQAYGKMFDEMRHDSEESVDSVVDSQS